MVSETKAAAVACVEGVARTMASRLEELTGALHTTLAGEIADLRGDLPLLELLRSSIASNLETLVHVLRYDIPARDVVAPSAAVLYARRLAQRGVSPNALLRAYRLGHQRVVHWALEEIARGADDVAVAYAATQQLLAVTFGYIDVVSEQVVTEYEAERERWLTNRATVRAATIAEVLSGDLVDVAAAEQALGYRLGQHHLGVVVWCTDDAAPGAQLRQLERLVTQVATAVRCGGPAALRAA